MISAILVASLLFAQGAPASTSVAPSAVAPSSTVSPVIVNGKKGASKADGSELICRDEVVLGTLFPKRTCMRRDAFVERTRQDQKEAREMTNLRPYKLPE